MKLNTLYFLTSNKGKISEARAILGFPIEIFEHEIDEIQSLNVERIVRKKVQDAFALVRKPVIVDDVSVEVKAWNGFPGPFIKYLREAGGNDLLLKMLKSEKDRTVIVKAAIGFYDGKTIYSFVGEVKGTMAASPRGDKGWGFDPLFIPESLGKTLGEVDGEIKNQFSHRRVALDIFKKFLIQEGYI